MRVAVRQWRLNAPEGFHWTDDDVLHEKTQSFLNGIIAGAVLWSVGFFVVAVVAR